jgi:VRR-NUC domain
MRWTDVVPGVPDLAIAAPSGRIYFIEVKAPGGSLSRAQRDGHDRLVGLRTPAAIVRSIDEARLAFAVWRIETREAAR